MNFRKIKHLTLLLTLMAIGYSFTPIKKVTIKGSDTMVILTQKWAEVFMKKNKGTVIQVSGGGSGQGFEALINGSIDVANASRLIKPSEKKRMQDKFGTEGIQIPCAKDGISIFLNNSNPVSELTIDQLGAIYSGKITNWKEVGGLDAPIQLYSREEESGTYEFFKEFVVKAEFSSHCQILSATASIVYAVRKNKFAIGYGGAAYSDGVKNCKVKTNSLTPGVLPMPATIKNHSYPISRSLYMYLKSEPTGHTKAFIDWILSPSGQNLIEEVGYYPLK
jgi:phosphate transport system substrate-binding protein